MELRLAFVLIIKGGRAVGEDEVRYGSDNDFRSAFSMCYIPLDGINHGSRTSGTQLDLFRFIKKLFRLTNMHYTNPLDLDPS